MSALSRILQSLENPEALETLFEENPAEFTRAIDNLAAQPNASAAVRFWHVRLHRKPRQETASGRTTLFAILFAIPAAIASRIPFYSPDWIPEADRDDWYLCNWIFLVVPFIAAYLCMHSESHWRKKAAAFLVLALGCAFSNWVFEFRDSVELAVLLALLHAPVIAWAALSLLMPGRSFLNFTSSTLLITLLLYVPGALLVFLINALFNLIGLSEAAETAFSHVAPFGMAAAPVIAAHIVRANSALPGKLLGLVTISVAPLVTAVLVVFVLVLPFRLTASIYEDKSILEILNYSVLFCLGIFLTASASDAKPGRILSGVFVLMSGALALLAIFLLTACLYWFYTYGYTPVRLAALLLDLICFVHAALAFRESARLLRDPGGRIAIHDRILPVYGAYLALAGLLLPAYTIATA